MISTLYNREGHLVENFGTNLSAGYMCQYSIYHNYIVYRINTFYLFL